MESRCDLTCLVSQWLKQNFRIYAFYPFWSSKKFWQFLKAYFSPQIRWQTRHPREKYNETPPYDHLVGTATFFGRLAKTAIHFRVKKNPLQYGHFFWAHSVTVLTRFHCTAKYTQYTVDRKKLFKVVTSHQVVWIVLVKFKQTPPGFATHLQLHSLFSQRSEWTLSNPQNFAFSLFPVSPGYYHDYSRSKRNRRR